ncbi:MAG TPA: hypothetical protein DCE44_14095, partial [Verrucomicrobiales bacterium]|nr:hypothetical protein [Verrucomicrobiales bacterium]
MPDPSPSQNPPPIQSAADEAPPAPPLPPLISPDGDSQGRHSRGQAAGVFGRLGSLALHWRRWRVLILLALFGLPNTRDLAVAVWGAVNLWLLVRAGFWSLLHLSRIWSERGAIMRWAFWPALLATLLLRSTLEPGLAEVTGQWLPSSVFYAVSLILFFPILIVASLLWSLFGAVIGAYGARDAPDSGLARWGVRGWWLASLLAGLLMAALQPLKPPAEWMAALFIGVPLAAWGLQRLARHYGGRSLSDRIDVWLASHCVYCTKLGPNLDFRGEWLALVGFLITWVCVSLKLLMPLEASALLSGVRLLNAISPGRFEFKVEERIPGTPETNGIPRFSFRLGAPKTSAQVVLLEWDGPCLREATTTNSEAGIQARLIRELSNLGARRIVLPPPTLELATIESQADPHQAPSPKSDDVARSKRDLSDLGAAMRQAGNVLLLAPARNVLDLELVPSGPNVGQGTESFASLESSALEVGSTRLSPIQIAALPAISLQWADNEPAPASVRLAGALRGNTNLHPQAVGTRTISILGQDYPVIDSTQGRLLLDFVTATRHRDFARISYSSVLRREPLFDANAGQSGSWIPPAEFFRDKVVFLQPLRSRWLASPW